MFLIVGLGNPDKKYENTRHNIGFEALKHFAGVNNILLNKNKFNAIYGEKTINGEKVILVMPQTYMNLSGESVGKFASFYKISPENIIVLHDDVSISPGRLRIRKKGSAGGHNGLKSIISHLGSDNFIRMKIGVGEPENKDFDLADYVLGKFTKEENEILSPIIKNVSSALNLCISDNVDLAMNRFNN